MSEYVITRGVELIPGMSVYRMRRVFFVGCIVTLALGAIVFAVGCFGGGRLAPFDLALVWLSFASLGLTSIVTAILLHKRNLEAVAGYTTVPNAFINLATVDDKTAAVIREPGEPLLDSAEYERRCAAAQRWARG